MGPGYLLDEHFSQSPRTHTDVKNVFGILMRRSVLVLMCILMGSAAAATAQVEPSATTRQFTMTVGGFASGFQPDSSGLTTDGSSNYLLGMGTYVDMRFRRWVQIEAEGRWLRFNEYYGEHQDNYLIGPRLPIHQFGRATAYGKVLVGYGKMTFPFGYGYGTFTDIAYGGGVDYKLTRKLSIRAIDFEYQQWPKWINNSALYPYGVSVGVGYKVF